MVRLPTSTDVLEAITARLVPLVAPELILLFGSRATGEPREDSDYDLMLVFGDGVDVAAQRRAAWDALRDAHIAADVLARSTADYLRRQHDPGCLEWLVSREGRLLYSSGSVPQRSAASRVREHTSEGEAEWLRRSDADFEEAELSLEAELPRRPVPDAICFHSHACVEKLLKALIARHGSFPPRTHELPLLLALLPESIARDATLVDACGQLQALYPAARYPELPMPSVEQARTAFAAASQVRARLRA